MALKRAELHVAMVIFQLGYAGQHVAMRAALKLGVSKLVFQIYRNTIAFLFVAPFAYFLEKKERPVLSAWFLLRFFFLGFVGITLNQGFYFIGLDNTSTTFASATENAVPAIAFFLATLLGLEQVHMKRRDGLAKVFGTLISFIGASVITLYKGPTIYGPTPSNRSDLFLPLEGSNGKNWALGCVCCLGHSLCWGGLIVLQAIILRKYPAPISVYSFSCFFGVLQFSAIAGYIERDFQAWCFTSMGEFFSLLYSGLIVSGIGFGIQIWVVQRGGPVFVSGYLPLQTILIAIIASIALGEEFYLGSIIGAMLIITGLYLVVWGKGEEIKLGVTEHVITSAPESDDAGKLVSSISSLKQPLLPSSCR